MGVVGGGEGGGVDGGALAEVGEGEGGVDGADAVEVLVDEAVEEVADVEAIGAADGFGVGGDVDGAVVAEEVVELGLVGEGVDFFEVGEEEQADFFGGAADAIEEDAFVAMVGADFDDVALVSDDVDEFELFEEGGDGGEAFADFGACFDGDAEGRGVVEVEADEGVADGTEFPVGDEEVHGLEIGEGVGAVFVADGEIVGGAVVEVAEASEVDEVAVEGGAGHDGDVGSPGAVMGGVDGGPPDEDGEKEGGEEEEAVFGAGAPEEMEAEGEDGEGEQGAEGEPREVGVVNGEGGPGDEEGAAEEAGNGDEPEGGFEEPEGLGGIWWVGGGGHGVRR